MGSTWLRTKTVRDIVRFFLRRKNCERRVSVHRFLSTRTDRLTRQELGGQPAALSANATRAGHPQGFGERKAEPAPNNQSTNLKLPPYRAKILTCPLPLQSR